MATITWLGEPDGRGTNDWNGYTFQKGKPVEVSDPYIIHKARNNQYFTVKGGDTKESKEAEKKDDEYTALHATVTAERRASGADAFAAQQSADKKAAELAAKRQAEDDKIAAFPDTASDPVKRPSHR